MMMIIIKKNIYMDKLLDIQNYYCDCAVVCVCVCILIQHLYFSFFIEEEHGQSITAISEFKAVIK